MNRKENSKNKCDGLELLSSLGASSIAAAFFDPQYRGLLDKLHFGNEGRGRGTARCSLPQMSEPTIRAFIDELERILRPSGHLFLWVDKYHLCQGVSGWLGNTAFNLVDMVTWDKGRIGMGYRTRRQAEYLIVLQKSPVRAKGCWTDHSIPDVWREAATKNHHHGKPVELQKRLIEAVTRKGETVVDPAAGGYSVLEACRLSGRTFIGCDISFG